jgi:protein TonB
MPKRIVLILAVAALAACSGVPPNADGRSHAGAAAERSETTRDGTSTAASVNDYKQDLANRIVQTSPIQVFVGRPQALLRSVVVVKYYIDANGRLLRSDILRSNRDRATETTALVTLRKAAPFPKPAAHLLRGGRVEILETWLFNNDGRFQLRTLAEAQMNE